VSLSPDGKEGLSASGDVLVLWDVRRGKLLREMQPRPRDPIPDTKWPSGKFAQEWKRREITGVAVDWKARRAVTGDREGVLRFWDLSKGKVVRKVEVFPPPDGEGPRQVYFGVRGLCLSPDGKYLCVAAWDGKGESKVRVWDVERGAWLKVKRTRAEKVVALSDDLHAVLVDGGRLGLWHLPTGNAVWTDKGKNWHITEFVAAPSPDGKRLLLSAPTKHFLRPLPWKR
jgi:WD40 repeat protein